MKRIFLACLLCWSAFANTPIDEPPPYDGAPSLGGSICFLAVRGTDPAKTTDESTDLPKEEQGPSPEEQATTIAELADAANCACVGYITETKDPRWEEALQQAARKVGLSIYHDLPEQDTLSLKLSIRERLPRVPEVIRTFQRAAAEGRGLVLQVETEADGSVPPEVQSLLQRVGKWRRLHKQAFEQCFPVPSVTLPEGWYATVVGEDTFLFPPAMRPKKEYRLRIPAHEIDTVVPGVIGQPNVVIRIERVEESGEDEPRAFMQLTIPAEVWKHAPEGLPVLKLANAQ